MATVRAGSIAALEPQALSGLTRPGLNRLVLPDKGPISLEQRCWLPPCAPWTWWRATSVLGALEWLQVLAIGSSELDVFSVLTLVPALHVHCLTALHTLDLTKIGGLQGPSAWRAFSLGWLPQCWSHQPATRQQKICEDSLSFVFNLHPKP